MTRIGARLVFAHAGLATLGFVMLVAGCDSLYKRNTIEYRVAGVAGPATPVQIGYYGADQTYTSVTVQALPWSSSFRCDHARRHLVIEAEGVSRLDSVRVSIYVNKELLASEADTVGPRAAAWIDRYWP
jgi:hypothetical protein